MKIIISNLIQIIDPNPDIINYCKQQLTFKNPDYQKKVQMGFYTGKTPRYIKLYDYNSSDNSVCVPIGCFEDIFKMVNDKSLYKDYSVVIPRDIKSNIELRDYQQPCLNALKQHYNGILLLPCGTGKTECALQIASFLGQKTLFIAHTNDLVKQAHDRCLDKMNVKTSMIGDGKVDLSGDIVFATVQTLFKKLDEIPQDTFGLVVCDECHHIAANADSVGMFRNCIDYFAARYKLGLTATLHRADGLESCIPKLLGDIIYEIKEDGSDYIGVYDGKEVIRFPKDKFQVPAKVYMTKTNYSIVDENNNYRDVFDKNGMTISFSKLITDISCDKERNDLIIKLVKYMSGSTIILSDRVDQLTYLQSKIPNSVEIDGKTKKDVREKALEDIKSGKKKVLLASYKLAKEGLDCKILQNVVFATPVKDYAIVVQCIGRCQRPYEGKKIARVFDLMDNVSTLKRFTGKRRNTYKKMNYEYVDFEIGGV